MKSKTAKKVPLVNESCSEAISITTMGAPPLTFDQNNAKTKATLRKNPMIKYFIVPGRTGPKSRASSSAESTSPYSESVLSIDNYNVVVSEKPNDSVRPSLRIQKETNHIYIPSQDLEAVAENVTNCDV